MISLSPQSDFKPQFSSFQHARSTTLCASVGGTKYAVKRCLIGDVPDGVGFWTGNDEEYLAFLALRPISYGCISGFEAFKAWTDPDFRRRGLARELLVQACRALGQIISDKTGMTKEAYELWQGIGRAGDLQLHYLDCRNGNICPLADIPPADLYSCFDSGARWQMLLRP